jgi:hypothetical protein
MFRSIKSHHHITSPMMKTETFLETSVYFIHLTRLIAREDSIESCRWESFRSYKMFPQLNLWKISVVYSKN